MCNGGAVRCFVADTGKETPAVELEFVQLLGPCSIPTKPNNISVVPPTDLQSDRIFNGVTIWASHCQMTYLDGLIDLTRGTYEESEGHGQVKLTVEPDSWRRLTNAVARRNPSSLGGRSTTRNVDTQPVVSHISHLTV